MKFACPKCSTRYSIADEKVPPAKTLRFPCKKCGNVIRLRRKATTGASTKPSPTGGETRVAPLAELNKLRDEAATTAPVAIQEETTAPTLSAQTPVALGNGGATRVAPVAELNELRSEARAAAVATSQSDPLGFGNTTRIASVKDISKALAAAQDDGPAPAMSAAAAVNERPLSSWAPPAQKPVPKQTPQWYVLISGKQTGPLSVAQVHAKLESKEIGERNYVWRDGMDDWKRLSTVDELAATPPPKQVTQPAADSFENEEFSDSTVAMDVSQLRKQLLKSMDATQAQQSQQPQEKPLQNSEENLEELQLEPAEPEPEGEFSATTELMPQKRLSVETVLAPQQADDMTSRSTSVTDPVDLYRLDNATTDPAGHDKDITVSKPNDVTDPATIDALSGAPTGQRMLRPEFIPKEITGESELFGRDPDDSSQVNEILNATTIPIPAPSTQSPLRHLANPDEDAFGPPLVGEDFESSLSELQDPGFPIDVPPSDVPAYLDGPPGESTRVFMATAGLYRRRRTHRVAAVAGVIFFIMLVGIISLDIMGTLEIPGMGFLYQTTGLVDPNTERGLARVEEALDSGELDAERRAKLVAMREKLLGTPGTAHRPGGKTKRQGNKSEIGGATETIRDPGEMGKDERDIAADIFNDDRKKDNAIRLDDPSKIQAPNLPDGLTEKAIGQVVTDNSSSMKLCFNESMRKGEKLAGKMEMEVTIAPDGRVTDVQISTDQFRRTTMGTCTMRRIKNWRFPQYNGEPVTVVLPYHLQSGF